MSAANRVGELEGRSPSRRVSRPTPGRAYKRAILVAFAVAASCGGPQEPGGFGEECFRDDDCAPGLVCVGMESMTARVCTNEVNGLVSMVPGPQAPAEGGAPAAGGAPDQAGAPPIPVGGGAGTGGGGTGGNGGSGGGAGTAGSAGTSGSAGTGGGGTGGTGGTDPLAGAGGV